MKYHRWCAAALAALAVVLVTNAPRAEGKWEVGVKGNVNGSKLRGDQVGFWVSQPGLDVSGTVGDSKIGYGVGAYARMYTSDFLALQLEAWYYQKGGEGDVFGVIEVETGANTTMPGDVEGKLTVHLDYVEVPLLAVFVFPADEEGKFTLNGQLGGYVGFNTRARVQLEGRARVQLPNFASRIVDFDQTAEFTQYTSSTDFGGIIGAGVEVATSKVKLIFDARFSFGLRSIDNTTADRKIYNQSFAFTFGVGFPL